MLATLGLVIANLGLARWYSPFGWCAWGPRLTFPFLGAVGVIAVYLVTTQVINFFMEAGKKYWLLIFVCVVVVSSLPNLTARLDPGAFFVKMFAPTKIEIESGIKNFTVQLAPANLYMAAASKIYARNIVLPITFDVARHKWPISLLRLFSLYLISKRIFSAD